MFEAEYFFTLWSVNWLNSISEEKCHILFHGDYCKDKIAVSKAKIGYCR